MRRVAVTLRAGPAHMHNWKSHVLWEFAASYERSLTFLQKTGMLQRVLKHAVSGCHRAVVTNGRPVLPETDRSSACIALLIRALIATKEEFLLTIFNVLGLRNDRHFATAEADVAHLAVGGS